jgi:RNase H-fold protein (predicted Holliday junction resolvase)
MADASVVKSVEGEKSADGVDAAVIGEALETVDVPRQSLLDVVMKRAEELQLLEKIQRVVIAGKFKKAGDNGEGTKDAVDDIVRQLQNQDEDDGEITGILLGFPGCFLCVSSSCVALLDVLGFKL